MLSLLRQDVLIYLTRNKSKLINLKYQKRLYLVKRSIVH
ncbi:Uncharacterised protein [Vibrio cholerae]|nr:Uncharacterised protein [Vibrio cholerae]